MATTAVAESDDDDLQRRVVSVDDKSVEVTAAIRQLNTALSPLHPNPKQPPLTTKEAPFVLYGNLFGTGTSYALVELDGPEIGVGFAKWDGTSWVPRGLWRISPVYRPQGWESTGHDSLPITPAASPFRLEKKLGPVDIIAVGEVWRCWQEHYLFDFDPRTGSLKLIAESMSQPKLAGDLVVLPYSSGHRAVFQGWRYMRWNGHELAQVARWQEGVNEHDIDPRFMDGQLDEAERLMPDGTRTEYVIKSAPSESDKEEVFLIQRDGKEFAWLTISWKKPDPSRGEATVHGYLFEKLIGLPRNLYPGADGKIPRLEDAASITVKGSQEATALFKGGRQ